jgi:hypothetical protein
MAQSRVFKVDQWSGTQKKLILTTTTTPSPVCFDGFSFHRYLPTLIWRIEMAQMEKYLRKLIRFRVDRYSGWYACLNMIDARIWILKYQSEWHTVMFLRSSGNPVALDLRRFEIYRRSKVGHIFRWRVSIAFPNPERKCAILARLLGAMFWEYNSRCFDEIQGARFWFDTKKLWS